MTDSKAMDIIADRVDRLACAKCGHHMDLSDVAPFNEIVCPKCNTKQTAPMRLGSFLLVDELGKGGMGSVFRAFDSTLGRYVAIKVMQKHLADDKKFAENFLREARAAAALNHPNVVQIYSCGQERGQLYIVMELVDGGRLDKMIEGGKALDEVFTLEVGVMVSEGLDAANAIGMIHGDIKPANILFDKQRRAKVVDFGLARFHAQQHLQPGEIWGTPYYIAPEKVRAQKEDQRADIYSLGATLFHVLAGHPPFEGETAKDVVLARLKSPAISLRTVRPSIQPETADVIARTLEQDPSLRYPTYKSLLADMEEALRVARSRHGMPPPDDEKKSRMPLVIGAAVLAAAAGGAFYFIGGPAEEEAPPTPIVGPVTPSPDQPGDTPATPPEPAVDTHPVQPFTPAIQESLVGVVNAWKDGQPRKYEAELGDLVGTMPTRHVGRTSWGRVLQALPSWMDQREREMAAFLGGIQNATLATLPDERPNPGAMPQAAARFMVGQINAGELGAVAKEWPPWFGDWIEFLLGIHHIRAKDAEAAQRHLSAYTSRTAGEEIAWPYAYQPLAAEWLERIESFQAAVKKAESETPERALRTLRPFQRNVPPWLKALADDEMAKAEARKKDDEALKKEEEARAKAASIEADMQKIEAARMEIFALIQARDFRRAPTRLRQLAWPLETDEGRTAYTNLEESYRRMEAMRQLIFDGLRGNPVPQSAIPQLGGDALGASTSGIRISLGGHGWRDLPWEQVNERLMASLAEYYIAQMPEAERADMTLSLAVFAYQSRGLGPAKLYADRAVGLDGSLRPKARALMPELNWN